MKANRIFNMLTTIYICMMIAYNFLVTGVAIYELGATGEQVYFWASLMFGALGIMGFLALL
jgi:hypothetical protein